MWFRKCGWRADYDGQLGNAATNAVLRPTETVGKDSGITHLSAGGVHVLALRSDGTVFAWGDDEAGEIGNGIRSETPTLPAEVTGLTGVTQVSAGWYFSLAVHYPVLRRVRPDTGRMFVPGAGRANARLLARWCFAKRCLAATARTAAHQKYGEMVPMESGVGGS